jgi:hypothetical protein
MNTINKRLICIVSILVTSFCLKAQTLVLSGVIVDEDLEAISGAKIQSKDTVLLGTTQSNGHFEIVVPHNLSEILLSCIGLEWSIVKLDAGCNNHEIVMMKAGTYDYTSSKQRTKKRLKRFSDLPKKHQEAFRQGVFKKDSPCFKYVFIP